MAGHHSAHPLVVIAKLGVDAGVLRVLTAVTEPLHALQLSAAHQHCAFVILRGWHGMTLQEKEKKKEEYWFNEKWSKSKSVQVNKAEVIWAHQAAGGVSSASAHHPQAPEDVVGESADANLIFHHRHRQTLQLLRILVCFQNNKDRLCFVSLSI